MAGTEIALTDVSDWFDFEAGSASLDQPAETHEAFFLARLAEDWLRGLGSEPFFLRVDPWGPHPPYITCPPFRGSLDELVIELSPNFSLDLESRPDHHGRYRDYWRATLGFDPHSWRLMVTRALEHVALVEAALAGLLDVLDQLEQASRTLVIFTADHGDAVGSNGGVANKGGLMVEETMRVPLMIRGPGVVTGSNCDQLVSTLDLASTLLDICGLQGDRGLHGRSLVPLFKEGRTAWRRGFMAQHYGLHEPILQRAYYNGDYKTRGSGRRIRRALRSAMRSL